MNVYFKLEQAYFSDLDKIKKKNNKHTRQTQRALNQFGELTQ